MSDHSFMSDRSRLVTLDAVRGLAAVCVVLVHAGLEINNPEIARFSYLAVDLFFVMSGFVISRAYDDKLLGGLTWQRFMLLRLVRLYPSMFLGLLAGFAAYFIIPASAYPIGMIPGGTYHAGWYSIAHFFLIPDLTAREGIFPINGVFWSLFFELVANFVHGIAIRRITIPRLALFVVAMGGWWAYTAYTWGKWGWGGGWNSSTFYGGFLRVSWAYAAGMLLQRVAGERWKAPAWLPVVIAALVFLVPNVGGILPRIVITLFVINPLIVILAAGADVPAAAQRIARWIGGISYPLYATHHPLLLILVSRFRPGAAGMALSVAVVIAAATLIEYGYDVPIRKRLMAAIRAASPREYSPRLVRD